MNDHPHLYRLYRIFKEENEPFRKVHRLIDCFECFIKMYTAIFLSEYFRENKISTEMRQLLYEGLRFPSLGTWQKFSDTIYNEFKINQHQYLLNGFEEGFILLKTFTERDNPENIIEFRNKYAHGATPNNNSCLSDCLRFTPYLEKLANEQWLLDSATFVNTGGYVCIKNKGGKWLSLFPILVIESKDLKNRIVFFNDLDYYNTKVGFLNYITAKHFREKELFSQFNKTFKLSQTYNASKTKDFEKNRRIEDLTLSFTGRENDIEYINQFIKKKNKGFLTITGNPGMGKSTLIAEAYKKIKKTNNPLIYPILYFIQRGSGNDAYSLLKYLHDKIDESKILSNKNRGSSTQELFNSLKDKLNAWSQRSDGIKLLLIIDGLDEGVEPPNNFITDYLFNQPIPQVLFIYSTRPGGHDKIIDFLDILPRENTARLPLTGLTKENIRGLLYEVTNKYEIEQDWVDIILEKSQGSALYLKLLCKDLQYDRLVINDAKTLPDNINECYHRIFRNYRKFSESDTILNCIFLFAVAKEGLTQHHLELILNIGPGTSMSALSVLKEVLLVDENNLNAYILFHESFRSYILDKFPSHILDAHRKVVLFGNKWYDLKGKYEQRYTLKYQYLHLLYLSASDSEFNKQLIEFSTDVNYKNEQKNVLKSFRYTQYLLSESLKIYCIENNIESVTDLSLALIELKRNESNDYHQIFILFSVGEYDVALERIENFGKEEKVSVTKKFILYMLCLQHFTLGDFKMHPNKTEICNLLLEDLEKKLTTDHSILNWDDFYPSNLMYLISIELNKMGINDGYLWKRTISWNSDFIKYLIDIDNTGFNVLKNSIFLINNDEKEAKEFRYKALAVKEIAIKLISVDKINTAKEILNYALNKILNREKNGILIHGVKLGTDHTFWIGKSTFLINIAEGFSLLGEKKQAYSIIKKAEKGCYSYDIEAIIKNLIKLGYAEEAIKFSEKLSKTKDLFRIGDLVVAYMCLAKYFKNYENISRTQNYISKAIKVSLEWKNNPLIIDYYSDDLTSTEYPLKMICEFLAEMGMVDDIIKIKKYFLDPNPNQILRYLVTCCVMNNSINDGLKLVEASESKFKDYIYYDLAKLALNNLDFANVLLSLNRIRIKDSYWKSEASDLYINCYSQLNQFDLLLTTLKSFKSSKLLNKLTKDASAIFVNKGQIENTYKILEYQINKNIIEKEIQYILYTIKSMIDYYEVNENNENVIKSIYFILCIGETMIKDNDLLSRWIAKIIKKLVKLENVELALLLFYNTWVLNGNDEKEDELQYKSEAANIIVDYLIKKNEFDEVFKIVNCFSSKSDLFNKTELENKIEKNKNYKNHINTNTDLGDFKIYIFKKDVNISLLWEVINELVNLNRNKDAIFFLNHEKLLNFECHDIYPFAYSLFERGAYDIVEYLINICIIHIKNNIDTLIDEGTKGFRYISYFADLQIEMKNFHFLAEYNDLFSTLLNKYKQKGKIIENWILTGCYFKLKDYSNFFALIDVFKLEGEKTVVIEKYSKEYYIRFGLNKSLEFINVIPYDYIKRQWFYFLVKSLMPYEITESNFSSLINIGKDNVEIIENILMHYCVSQIFYSDKPNSSNLNEISKALNVSTFRDNIREVDLALTDRIKYIFKRTI